MSYIKYFLPFFVFSFIACSKDESESIETQKTIFPHKKHTVILYAMADNDLYPYAEKNIQDIESQWKNSFDGNFVVVLDTPDYVRAKRPPVFKIEETENIEILSHISDFQSSNPKVMKKVLTDIKLQFPSDKYTLILWSHGTGWLPQGVDLQQDFSIPSKSFGKDKSYEMSIFELSEALPDNGFETIIFDACFMASVEVLYELRKKSKYFIASSAEILQTGFPYHSLTPMFFDDSKMPIHWAIDFYDFYNDKKGMYRSATVSVTENYFFDELAQMIKDFQVSKKRLTFSVEKQRIQQFDRSKTPIFYDFYDYLEKLDGENSVRLESIKNVLKKLIPYKAHTPTFAKRLEINMHSGLTTYAFLRESDLTLSSYYKKYTWCMYL